MAAELCTDLTFFDGIINETQLQSTEKNVGKLEKCKPRKSNSPNTGTEKKTRSRKSLEKENKTPTDKARQASKKPQRKPLALLNEDATAPNTEDVSAKKTGRRSAKAMPSATEAKAPKKERQSVPKIIVHRDYPVKGKGKEKDGKKSVAGLSKSLDGSSTTGRPSLRERQKTSETNDHLFRRSFNDLTNVRVTSPKGRLTKARGKEAATKSEPRQTKLKPGHPEFDEMLEKLGILFPNVDPEFLKSEFVKFKGSLSQTIEFITVKEKTTGLPTRDEYVRKLEAERLQNKFLENFSVADFLKIIPDPWDYFLKTEKSSSALYLGHSLHYLKNKYKRHYTQAIHDALKKNGNSLYLADKDLQKKNRLMKMRTTNRSKSECDAGRPMTLNLQFLYEVAFIENESKIKSYMKKAEAARHKKLKDAEKAGALLKCQYCNDFSLLQDDAVNCPANHVFCKNCVVKYVEIRMEKNNFQFKCLINCEERFLLEALQGVFSPFMMTKMLMRNELEEIKAAGFNDFVYCPFCLAVAKIPQEITVFKCFNSDCMLESCRLCKEFSHVPLKCHELKKFDRAILDVQEEENEKEDEAEEEKKEEEKAEDKLEEGALLKCRFCKGEFLKKEDSNQMVCPCGATICSICRQPFPECEHFKIASSSSRLSSGSDGTEFADCNAELNQDPDSSKKFLAFLSSESDTF